MRLFKLFICIVAVLALFSGCSKKDDGGVRVIIVGTDGLRWQEVFGGIDAAIIDSSKYNGKEVAKNLFWKETREERREALMPFTWDFIAKNGILIGDKENGSSFSVTNDMWFSYPGWSEMIVGYADDEHIRSNEGIPNPNISVLEVAQNTEKYNGKVMAFGSWERFNEIVNEERCGFPVNAGFEGYPDGSKTSAKEEYLTRILKGMVPYVNTVRQDVITHEFALEAMRTRHPEFLFIGYGETDDWAHAYKYDISNICCHNFDGYLRELWEYAQSDPFYRDRTVFIVSTDHGRGWFNAWDAHGRSIEGSGDTWLMVYGKGIPAKGVLTSGEYHTNQIAPTAAKLLGIELPAHEGMGEPLDFDSMK
ncbi:MAG: hypothetical protein II552_00905 [Bacteroidales bacterium]|nr:hypothetical protein [Bacteroidales bacterium]